MDELFEASFSSVAESGRPLSKCGLCRRYLKYISSRPQRLYCVQCDQTYSLPQGGSIKLYKVCVWVGSVCEGMSVVCGCERSVVCDGVCCVQEIKCPLDEFELLLFTSVNGRKVWNILQNLCFNFIIITILILPPPTPTHTHTHTVVPCVSLLLQWATIQGCEWRDELQCVSSRELPSC